MDTANPTRDPAALFDPERVPGIVREAQAGSNESGVHDRLVARLASGWVVFGEVQPFQGYCMLMTEPGVGALSEMDPQTKMRFLEDMTTIGEALGEVTGCERVNYSILGNSAPAMHAHIFPRYADESDSTRGLPPWYAYGDARRFDLSLDRDVVARLREALERRGAIAA